MNNETFRTVFRTFHHSEENENEIREQPSASSILAAYVEILRNLKFEARELGLSERFCDTIDALEQRIDEYMNAVFAKLGSDPNILMVPAINSRMADRGVLAINKAGREPVERRRELVIAFVGGLYSEIESLSPFFNDPNLPEAPILFAEVASYEAHRAVRIAIDEPRNLLEGLAKGSQEQLESMTRTATAMSHDHITASEKIAIAERRLKTVFDAFETNLAGFKAAALAALHYNTAGAYWGAHANRSGWASTIAGLFLISLLLIAPGVVLWRADEVITLLRHVSEATADSLPENPTALQLSVLAVNRLVLVSVPIALYFWAIRLIARFFNRSLHLMDDASRRRTMMNTYLQLTERGAVSQEHRALILAALFNPLRPVEDKSEADVLANAIEKAIAK
ncbi:hypothetical protein E0H51_19775 [Rhizobium leguminosarum bv. viciae]|uniref:DUF6161 domain-containing protein n=1 Tax=Rhizobium leguminosarum TaxID=384 RepID=UPI00103A2413|nr:DUF6161 domain-containing protein [Rhizobium leguminosarum]TBY74545.1 hypothetical protein E0H51_19775 [Rhizobium leguminosarum bv. viciae]